MLSKEEKDEIRMRGFYNYVFTAERVCCSRNHNAKWGDSRKRCLCNSSYHGGVYGSFSRAIAGILFVICRCLQLMGISSIKGHPVEFSWPLVAVVWYSMILINAIKQGGKRR